MEKRKICLFAIIILLIIFFAIPTYIILFTEQVEVEYITYKELQDNEIENRYESGDVVYLKDVLSGIWYNESANYTYLTFESNDEYRKAPWGYDAGFPKNITGEFKVDDEVEIKIEFKSGEDNGKDLQGHLIWIRHPGEENVRRI